MGRGVAPQGIRSRRLIANSRNSHGRASRANHSRLWHRGGRDRELSSIRLAAGHGPRATVPSRPAALSRTPAIS
jgi:hypothetical protein